MYARYPLDRIRAARRACGLAVGAILIATSCESNSPTPTTPPPGTSAPAPDVSVSDDPVIVAAGDLVCGPTTEVGRPCEHAAVAALVPSITPDAVLLLGDNQYESASLSEFNSVFDPVWGAHKSIIYPVAGNHEYGTAAAKGYFDYFNGVGVANGRAGPRGKGYYSFDLGAWHIVVINSNCGKVGGCNAGSPMEQWLRADLAANPAVCTLAAWHHPRYSSGRHGSIVNMKPIWQALYDYDADIVLSGHDHDYERFAPQNAAGVLDNARGLRQFVVGTGGKEHTGFPSIKPNSQQRDKTSFGLLKLTLHPTSYDWQFVPVPGQTLNDAGATSCH
jgi:acid phosphatase type 7